MKELIENLELKIQQSKDNHEREDIVDWDFSIGILISRKEAEIILNILKIYQGTK